MTLIDRKSIVDLKEKLSLSKQCILLNINRNYFYFSPKGEGSENLSLMKLLKKQYHITSFYGYRKMTVWFKRYGFQINEKRVRRLMKLVNWQTIYREPRTAIAAKEHKKYPYLLKGLEITQRNQVWATHITYIP
jgi:putative transposase